MDGYKIDLRSIPAGAEKSLHYVLDNTFFAALDDCSLSEGNVEVHVNIRETEGVYETVFQLQGQIVVSCDRCLDDMYQPIKTSGTLKIRLGSCHDETDDYIIIPQEEGVVDLAWYMYEFIVLAIPIKHVHPDGECNPQMLHYLTEHKATFSSEEWKQVKGLKQEGLC